ncbi:MAG TPA: GNAT family N-acetyltransferase [Candidatus Eisenbergiella stercoravium]|nr:GNAT family N-acetyltransferase [Candidatus Eisenbergiella stercoravium]
MKHKGTVRLETDRLILRPFTPEDALPMFRNWASDKEVTRFLTWPTHKNVEVTGRVIADWCKGYEAPDYYQWAIELKEIKEPIGSIAAVKTDDRTESATIGYCIGRRWWRQGITSEALREVIRFFFEEVGMNCVNACHDPRNPNSGRVMRSCGMALEGTWRAGGINNQGVCDETWYSILRSEYGKEAKPPITIRREKNEEQRTVEVLTRQAFWNVYGPGCTEHYVVHILRKHEDFVTELDLVAETADGRIVGNVMYTKARLIDENGNEAVILTFGPISVHPDFQRRGISRLLLEYSFEEARRLGYQAVVIFGDPDNYVSRGFKSCSRYHVCAQDGSYPAAMLVLELIPGLLDGRKWFYQENSAYSFDPAAAEQFDRQFEPLKKEYRPSQESFYIHSHSVIRSQ